MVFAFAGYLLLYQLDMLTFMFSSYYNRVNVYMKKHALRNQKTNVQITL